MPSFIPRASAAGSPSSTRSLAASRGTRSSSCRTNPASGRTRSICKAGTPRATRTASPTAGPGKEALGLDSQWPWLALGALGVYHGLNPAMGWLFAVALGFLKRNRRAVLEALIPIAIGHELAVGVVVLLVAMTQAFALPDVRPVGPIARVAFGLFKLRKPLSHPRWAGLQVG